MTRSLGSLTQSLEVRLRWHATEARRLVVRKRRERRLGDRRRGRYHRVAVHGGERRNLQTLVEIAVDKNSTVVFPAPLMSTIQELGAFLNRESNAAAPLASLSANGSTGDSPMEAGSR